MLALIDADIVVHRVGWTTEQESEGIARARTNEMIETILAETKASEYECWLSDDKENNFRYKLYPAYKSNRVQPRPKNYDAIKEHLVSEWDARFAYGMEADDALGISQMAHNSDNPENGATLHDCFIASIDKDLLQIPGQHYNFVKKEWTNVRIWEGLQWFYQQLLIGDTVDNISGCKGIGPVKARKAIVPIGPECGEIALLKAVYSLYHRQEKTRTPSEIIEHLKLAGSLLKIKQEENEPTWDSLSSNLMAELQSSFTQQAVAESTPSTEPTTLENQNPDGSVSSGSPMAVSSETESPAA